MIVWVLNIGNEFCHLENKWKKCRYFFKDPGSVVYMSFWAPQNKSELKT